MRKLYLVVALSALWTPAALAQVESTRADAEVGVRAHLELGFLAVLDHDITLGSGGTEIDYVEDLGQDNLYFVPRITAELDIWRQHIITFVYQPLDLVTDVVLARDLIADGLTYPAGTPVRSSYSFPFYRLGWAFDVLDDPQQELAFGLGGQLRNATIELRSLDGTLFRARRDIGPVPLLRARGRFTLAPQLFLGFEADGFYAPISVLNGSDNDVEGAIADVAFRVGTRFLPHVEGFLTVRYLGGGASGQSDPGASSEAPTNDGYQSNWLHFLFVTVGGTLDSRAR